MWWQGWLKINSKVHLSTRRSTNLLGLKKRNTCGIITMWSWVHCTIFVCLLIKLCGWWICYKNSTMISVMRCLCFLFQEFFLMIFLLYLSQTNNILVLILIWFGKKIRTESSPTNNQSIIMKIRGILICTNMRERKKDTARYVHILQMILST